MMTKAKATKKATQASTLLSGKQTLYTFVHVNKDNRKTTIPVTIAHTFRDESVARQRASEVEVAARFAGVYLSKDDISEQERWERILLWEKY